MTSPRRREIKSVRDIRAFTLILIGLSVYVPFAYLWAWELKTVYYSLGFAGLIGCGVALILLLPWRKTTSRLDRLLKYDTLFDDFFEAMIEEMEANDAKKGASWLTIDEAELRKLQNRKIHQLQSKTRTVADDFDYQKELANYCAMIWIRGRELE